MQVSAAQLMHIATVLGKPLAYFSSYDATSQTDAEAELLGLFHIVSSEWQERILSKVRTQVELYERVLPYIQVGIPEEFYGFLIYEQETALASPLYVW